VLRLRRYKAGLGDLLALQPDYVILDEQPIRFSATTGAMRELATRYGTVEHEAIAYDPNKLEARYDELDANFVPLAGFSGVDRPGPNLRIYRLEVPPVPDERRIERETALLWPRDPGPRA
jgi:hypothetical protein